MPQNPLAIILALFATSALAQDDVPVPSHRGSPVVPMRNADGTPKHKSVTNQMITGNWSGYVVANYLTSDLYTSASATWQVPAVTYGSTTDTSGWEFASQWVGIGGYCEAVNPEDTNCTLVDNTLIQLGTATQICSTTCNDSPAYYAWYEMLPAGSALIQLVNAGDIIDASLTCHSPCTQSTLQTWTLTMTDRGKWTWSQDFQYDSNLTSAEWILEAPYSGGILPLDNYTKMTFSPIAANDASQTMTLAANSLVLQDPWLQTSNPSNVDSTTAFSTCYGYGSGVFTSCTTGTISQQSEPTASLTASPSTVKKRQSSTLAWSSTNASACTGSGFNTHNTTSGSLLVYPSKTTTYSVTCSGGGGSATANATVTVIAH